MERTPLFTTPPTILFVGADAEVADVCARAVPAVKLLRLGNAAAAVQRMLVTRPLTVVVDASVKPDDLQDIRECAGDIRAGVVVVLTGAGPSLASDITSAVLAAEKARAEPGYVEPTRDDDGDD